LDDGVGRYLGISGLGSAEREVKRFDSRLKKLDLKHTIRNRLGLPDQLIEALLGNCAIALVVNVAAMRRTRRMSIDENAKWHETLTRCRSHHEVNIPSVKAIGDPPVGRIQCNRFSANRPIPLKRPMVER
jgi:hypothetical protein